MKVLTVNEGQAELDRLCDEALAGQVICLQRPDGRLVELTAVPAAASGKSHLAEELAASYEAGDWAEFENHCG